MAIEYLINDISQLYNVPLSVEDVHGIKIEENSIQIRFLNGVLLKILGEGIREIKELCILKILAESGGYPYDGILNLCEKSSLPNVFSLYKRLRECKTIQEKFRILREEEIYKHLEECIEMVVSRIYEKTNVIPRISLEVIERMRKIAQWYSFNCSLEEFKQQVKIKSYLKSLGNEIPIIYIDKTGKVLGIDVTNNLDRFKDIITYGTEPEVDGLTNAHILFKPHN